MKPRRTIAERLTANADIAGLAAFRIAFGTCMALDLLVQLASGRVAELWLRSSFHFSYPGFHWLPGLPGPAMLALHIALIALAALVAAGFFYRAAAVAFALGSLFMFFSDAAAYQNNAWLACLFSALLAVLPAHRSGSLDTARGRVPAASHVPTWTYALLRFQIAIVFIFSALARLTPAWLEGLPLKFWLTDAMHIEFIQPLLATAHAPALLARAIPAFEIMLIVLLLLRSTRLAAFIAAICMKLTALILLGPANYAWLPTLALLTFFDPAWPRRFHLLSGGPTPQATEPFTIRPMPFTFASFYIALQLVVPLRHHLIPDDVAWTEEGSTFAWRNNVRSKASSALFFITDPDQKKTHCVTPSDELADRQLRNLHKTPELIRQFAVHLADREEKIGRTRPVVRTRALAALNGKLPRLLLNPSADLASTAAPTPMTHAPWIMSPTNAPAGDGSASDVEELRNDYAQLKKELTILQTNPDTPPANLWRKEIQKILLLEKLQGAILAASNIEKPAPAD